STDMLSGTLDEISDPRLGPEELVRLWRAGDLTGLEHYVEEMRGKSPALHARMLAERNRNWLPALTQGLHGEEPLLVMVGAAHFAGPDGLLALLKAKGFTAVPVVSAETAR
ncbi:MAG: TraB/GumN family protein, partial [Nevskiales bacterium]|nr:TraB/GumN family protein [Nevskiales bacterium]